MKELFFIGAGVLIAIVVSRYFNSSVSVTGAAKVTPSGASAATDFSLSGDGNSGGGIASDITPWNNSGTHTASHPGVYPVTLPPVHATPPTQVVPIVRPSYPVRPMPPIRIARFA